MTKANDQDSAKDRESVPGTSKPTSADRGRLVKQQLLAAATELIAELGWNAVTTRVLAQRAGVASGLVHYHFTSLQALLREAAVGAMRALVAQAGDILGQATTVQDGLDMVVGELDSYSGNDPTSLLFIEAYLAATRDELLRTELAELVAEFRGDLAQWLRRLESDMPEQTASVLAAAVDGVMLHRALHPELTSATVAPVLRKVVTPS